MSECGYDYTLTKPFAWDAMMVMSPGFGFGLSFGMYCFTASWSNSSCECAVARGYSLMCWPSATCSLMLNRVDIASSLSRLDMVVRDQIGFSLCVRLTFDQSLFYLTNLDEESLYS